MLWRTVGFVLAVAALGGVTYKYLVEREIKSVVSLHASDKASHLVDMLVASGDTLESLKDGINDSEFLAMAHGSGVGSVYVYDRAGNPASRTGMDPTGAAGMGHQGAHEGHGGHTQPHQATSPSMQTDAPGPQGAETSVTQTQEEKAAHRHNHANGIDRDILRQLQGAPRPDVAQLNPLFAGTRDRYVAVETLDTADGKPHHYANVVLPILNRDQAIIGFVGFAMNVQNIYGALTQGIIAFSATFAGFGGLLIGVLALAFWGQKKLADTSSRSAGFLARHDTLTGLLNRQAFVSEANQLLQEDRLAAVGYVDADRFKLINDTYGHSVGDAFLKHIARLLSARFGDSALVSRFGGDEFTFALSEGDSDNFHSMIDEVRKQAANEVYIDGFTVTASISIGYTDWRHEDDLEDMLKRADTALYYAKAEGRNTAALYTETMGAAAERRRALEVRLRKACQEDGFQIVYQPLVDATSQEPVGYEALLRLRQEDGSPISPSEFVPLAEEIGLIEDIGRWVLVNAMREVGALDDGIGVSINLSAEQFKSGTLVGDVKDALFASSLPPSQLELEITESVLLDGSADVAHQIDALKELGISIAMDDFGTGFSSLSTLWRYGFDRIKIDKSFVQGLEDDPVRMEQMIGAIVMLGARMGMKITAEGIETKAQSEVLSQLGCDVLQGFYFGKPGPIERRKSTKLQGLG